MAYRFKKSEAIPHAIQRIFAEEIAEAVGQLIHSKKRAQAVHEARKNIKKIRGLLGLIESRLGSIYKREDRYFRDSAQRLSELRDTTVMLEVFDALAAKLANPEPNSLKEMRLNLERTQRDARPEKVETATVARLLNDAALHAHNWPLDNLDWVGLLPDLTSTYRAGRRALKHAVQDENPDLLHDFRKEVKQHWYHVRLFESVWDEKVRARATALRELETWLGDAHNLEVLRERLTADHETHRDRHQGRELLTLLQREADGLRLRALEAGGRLYSEKPRAFCEHMSTLCAAIRKGPSTQPLRAKTAVA